MGKINFLLFISMLFLTSCNQMPTSNNQDSNNTEIIEIYEGNDFEYEQMIGNNVKITNYFGNLSKVIIPNYIIHDNNKYQVVSIGNNAFDYCDFIEEIIINSNVKSIGSSAFYNCNSLNSITLPFIGGAKNSSERFSYIFGTSENVPTSLKKVVINGENSISDGAFYNCTSLTGIILSDITSIGKSAFQNCTSLTSIVIPNSVITIGESAFQNCTSLTSIVIPSSVTTIGSTIFVNCKSLTIYCEAESLPSGWNTRWDFAYNGSVYWGNEWKYVNGVPTLI